MNETVKSYLKQNPQYKTREKTDVFFPFGSFYSFDGIMDDTAYFVQENQLKDVDYWKKFVYQFKADPAPDTPTNAWRGEYWGKMMRGACITYQYTQDAELYKILTDTVLDLLSAQDALGRYSTYSVEGEFNGWDMWSRKYILLGLLHFHEICRDEALRKTVLDSACRHLDYIIKKVGNGENQVKITETSGIWGGVNSSSILEPVMRMYNATGKQEYLDFAAYIVNEGGSSMGNIFEMAYKNKKMPFEYPVVKAYEMMSCFEGLLEYYRATGIEKWKTAAENYAKRIMETDITVIGSAGCMHELFDHSAVTQTLTGRRGRMQETCVTVTWMKFCMQLLCLTGDITYAEEIEKSIFNGLYGAVNREKSPKNGGLIFDSYSPLLNFHRGIAIGGLQTLNGIAFYGCCAAIGAAGTGFAPQFVLQSTDKGVVFNTYACGAVNTKTPNNKDISFGIETEYPAEDDIEITTYLEDEEEFEVLLRIPAFADGASVTADGTVYRAEPGEYLSLNRVWKGGDKIKIHLDVSLKIIKAADNPEDKNSKKHIALKRGALLLARDRQVTDDVGEAIPYEKNIYIKKINSIDLPSQCQYLVSTDKGYATVMIDYASAGKTFDMESETECWFPTEKLPEQEITII